MSFSPITFSSHLISVSRRVLLVAQPSCALLLLLLSSETWSSHFTAIYLPRYIPRRCGLRLKFRYKFSQSSELPASHATNDPYYRSHRAYALSLFMFLSFFHMIRTLHRTEWRASRLKLQVTASLLDTLPNTFARPAHRSHVSPRSKPHVSKYSFSYFIISTG